MCPSANLYGVISHKKQCSYPALLKCHTSFHCNKNSQTSPLRSSLKWENGVSEADIEVGLNRTDAGLVLHEHNRVTLQEHFFWLQFHYTAFINIDLVAKPILTASYSLHVAIRFITVFPIPSQINPITTSTLCLTFSIPFTKKPSKPSLLI